MMSFDYFLLEGLSSVSDFLKQQYDNIFKSPNQSLNNLFNNYIKRIDTDKNVSNLYQRYIKSNQTVVQNEINNSESIDEINNIIGDEIKFFYFSLKPIVNKLQNNEFTVQEIFSTSRDKRLQSLMSYPEDKFANSVQQFVNEVIIPEIKKDSGLDKPKPKAKEKEEEETTTERIRYNVYRILEADENENINDIVLYKRSAIKWVNTSLFDLIKSKFRLLNQLSAGGSNIVDRVSRMIKSTNNDNAKKMIINKIINMNRDELERLSELLGLSEEEIGKI